MIYLLTTNRQSVIYYSTNHALEVFYFDSNILKVDKNAVDSRILPTLEETSLAVTHEIMHICNVSDAKKKKKKKKKKKTTLHSPTSKKRQMTPERKISECLSEFFHFLVVKFSVYLNRLVFVMELKRRVFVNEFE